MTTAGPLLEMAGVASGYGRTTVLHDLTLEVRSGAIVALIGANGAGKSTLAWTLAGFNPVTAGAVTFAGQNVTRWSAERRARAGLALVPEGRRLLTRLSVEDNLHLVLLGLRSRQSKRGAEAGADLAYSSFPVLGKRRSQVAGTLSGGEQQMLAIARSLLGAPRLLILDEPSIGLGPLVVEQIFRQIRQFVGETSCACLLIEQQAPSALAVADWGYVLERGRVSAAGPAQQLASRKDLQGLFLGGSLDEDLSCHQPTIAEDHQ